VLVLSVTSSGSKSDSRDSDSDSSSGSNPLAPNPWSNRVADTEGGKFGVLTTAARWRSLHCGEYTNPAFVH